MNNEENKENINLDNNSIVNNENSASDVDTEVNINNNSSNELSTNVSNIYDLQHNVDGENDSIV